MRWTMGVSLAILASGALMVLQGSMIKNVRDTSRAFLGDNKYNLESTMKGIYNPSTVSSVGSLEFNLNSSMFMYDESKKQLIISNDIGDLTNSNVQLLTPILVSNSNVSVLNKSINSIHVNVVPSEKDIRYYERSDSFSDGVSQALQTKLNTINANPRVPKRLKQRYISK